jgi:hypothetical protein
LLGLPPQELIERVNRYNRWSNKSTGALAVADIVKQVKEQLKSEARPGVFAITDGARPPPTSQLANTSLDVDATTSRSHSHRREGVVTCDDQDGPQLASSPEWSTMELCDFANALSDLRPREFATVTGLAPVMELDVQGNVFAITGSEGRNGSLCFVCYEKGHFTTACPLLTDKQRQKAMEARDRFYKSDRANWQERRFARRI